MPRKNRSKRKEPGAPRILVVDDHCLIRMALKLVIDDRGWVYCGGADDAESTLRLLQEKAPDLVLLDFYLSRGACIDLIRQIRSHSADVKILMISSTGDPVDITRALRAGANGFVMKEDSETELVEAIEATLDGRSVVSKSVSGDVLELLVQGESAKTGASCLSEREYEVLQLLGKGLSSKQIAEELGVSARTIGTHRENLKQKLKLKDASELLVYAVRHVERSRRD